MSLLLLEVILAIVFVQTATPEELAYTQKVSRETPIWHRTYFSTIRWQLDREGKCYWSLHGEPHYTEGIILTICQGRWRIYSADYLSGTDITEYGFDGQRSVPSRKMGTYKHRVYRFPLRSKRPSS